MQYPFYSVEAERELLEIRDELAACGLLWVEENLDPLDPFEEAA